LRGVGVSALKMRATHRVAPTDIPDLCYPKIPSPSGRGQGEGVFILPVATPVCGGVGVFALKMRATHRVAPTDIPDLCYPKKPSPSGRGQGEGVFILPVATPVCGA
jgi:uncharacterized spore protein YtfJ